MKLLINSVYEILKKTNNNYLLTILDTDIIEERIIYKNV